MGAKGKEMSALQSIIVKWSDIPTVLHAAAAVGENVCLFGPPGTGKSWIARQSNGGPVFAINLTEETAAYEIRGYDRLTDDGKQTYCLGPGYASWDVENGRFVVEEIEKTSGDAMSCLLGILDSRDVAMARLPDGREIRPKEGFHAIATSNMSSVDELPPALADRFPICLWVGAPNPDAIKMLPEDLREPARSTCCITDPERRIGLRKWIAYSKIREHLDPKLAGKAVFGRQHRDVSNAIKASKITS
jgi:MoxR-like ATPase